MKTLRIVIISLCAASACKGPPPESEQPAPAEVAYRHISHTDYELFAPTTRPEAVLVLFGGYPETAEDIQREFQVLDHAKAHEVAVLYSNFHEKLWLENDELEELAQGLCKAFEEHELPGDRLYLGGFSSGGNVALLAGNHLCTHQAGRWTPKGVFLVDAPVDLAQLYLGAEKHLERNFSAVAVQESRWLIDILSRKFGDPRLDARGYEAYSVFHLPTGNVENIAHLSKTAIRMYTEPDTLWWKTHRMADFDQLNAFPIHMLCENLRAKGWEKVSYIPTEGRGYRANGQRHPHSWSIVDPEDLVDWMMAN